MKGHRNARQDVLLVTELGDIVGAHYETEPGYIVSPDTVEAWHQDYSQQVLEPKKRLGIQVISERSKDPLVIFKNRQSLEGQTTGVIASRKQDEELAFMNAKKEKNKLFIWVAIIAALFAVVISVIVLVQLKSAPGGIKTVALYSTIMAFAVPVILKRKNTDILEKKDLSVISETNIKTRQCIIIVESTGEMAIRNLSSNLIPEKSLERNYKGIPTHLLGLTSDGELWAIEPDNKIEENSSPKDLFIALQYEKEVNAVYSLSDSLIEKMKIGFLFALCIVELIVLFMIITTVTGGKVA